jgi:hypothetical protein
VNEDLVTTSVDLNPVGEYPRCTNPLPRPAAPVDSGLCYSGDPVVSYTLLEDVEEEL